MERTRVDLRSLPGRLVRRLERELPAIGRARGRALLRRSLEDFRRLPEREPGRLPVDRSERRAVFESGTASFDRHYVYHVGWAARVLAETRPVRHVDVASSVYFLAAVSAFVPIDFYDYRTVDLRLEGLTVGAADLVALPFPDRSLESLSCMHVVEHIGLGRYGDPLDPDGDLRAMAELQRVVAPAGSLLFVVPVGRPRVVFNAHRVYAYEQVLAGLPELELVEFALVPDGDGGLVRHADASLVAEQEYGCGCFWLRRAG